MLEKLGSHRLADERAVGWDALAASVQALIQRRPSLVGRGDGEQQPVVRTAIDLGRRSVPIYKILVTPRPHTPLEQIMTASADAATRQPIALYKVGDHYVVRDGADEINAARARGQLFLPAFVTECIIEPRVTMPSVALRVLLDWEQAAFLSLTQLDQSRPAGLLNSSVIGGYPSLLRLIQRYAAEQPLTLQDGDLVSASARWHDEIYAPVARAIYRQGTLGYFPHYGVADLFIWAVEQQADASTLSGRVRQARRAIVALSLALRHGTDYAQHSPANQD